MPDAFKLGWKLAAVVNDAADPALLDGYRAERHPVASRVIEQTTRLTRMGTLDTAVERKLRNRAVQLLTSLPAVHRMVAEQLEKTDLDYWASHIVASSHRRGSVRPGDAAPDVPGSGLRELLIADDGTLALTFGPEVDSAAASLGGLRRIRIDSQAGTHAPALRIRRAGLSASSEKTLQDIRRRRRAPLEARRFP